MDAHDVDHEVASSVLGAIVRVLGVLEHDGRVPHDLAALVGEELVGRGRRRPTVFTTNKEVNLWGHVLHDLGEALLDRVLEGAPSST